MAEKIKLIDAEMQVAIADKRRFADNLEAEFNTHKAQVNAYNSFWLGQAHDRFTQRYAERHRAYEMAVQCLRDQADDMQRVLTEKQNTDQALMASLA